MTKPKHPFSGESWMKLMNSNICRNFTSHFRDIARKKLEKLKDIDIKNCCDTLNRIISHDWPKQNGVINEFLKMCK